MDHPQYASISLPTIGSLDMQCYYTDTSKVYPAKTFPIHLHDLIEIYVLEEGDVSFMVEKHLYHMSAGDALITKPNEMHNCILNSTSRHAHYCFWFRPSSDPLYADFLKRDSGVGNLITPPDGERAAFLDACHRLYDCAEGESDPLTSLAAAADVLVSLRRWLPTESRHEPLPTLLQTLLQDIEENATRIRELSYFRDKYFISGSTLGRLFRRHLGTSPKMYIETKKLSHACRLLREGRSVTDACLEAGFSDYSNFIRLFRARFGKTPMQYKRT